MSDERDDEAPIIETTGFGFVWQHLSKFKATEPPPSLVVSESNELQLGMCHDDYGKREPRVYSNVRCRIILHPQISMVVLQVACRPRQRYGGTRTSITTSASEQDTVASSSHEVEVTRMSMSSAPAQPTHRH